MADRTGESGMRADCATMHALEAADLAAMARRNGGAEVEFFGGYQEQPYDRDTSVDLLMVARRCEG